MHLPLALARTARRAVGAALALTVATTGFLAGAAPASANPSESSATRTRSGAYVGARNFTALAAFESMRGARATIGFDFLDGTSWTSMKNPWVMNGWSGKGLEVVYSAPMLPADSSTTLQAGARGSYNAHWKTIAQNLVAAKQPNAVLRIGWEMNGNWFRWSAIPDPGAYVAYWRQIVTTMRSVPGTNFRFEWAPNIGQGSKTGFNKESAYPGDAYVDLVGMSFYDQHWGMAPSRSADRWRDFLTMSGGLQWAADFSRAHGKRASLSEWGLSKRCDGHGGLDNPLYINNVLAFADKHDFYYESYYDWNVSSCEIHKVTTGVFPTAREAYKKWFQPRPVVTFSSGTPTTSTVPAADATLSAALKLSTSSSRSNPVALAGRTVSGKVYLFVTPSRTPASISYHLDDPTMSKAPRTVERTAPWDFLGGSTTVANPFDTSTLAAGSHTLTISVTYTDGSKQVGRASFTR
ncbi:glycoside hydrolase family 26 protein [Cellulomonas endophytica]|uniref:glycoside hydrolase family 26 protein n=1 Tax=Cellulomonas endophytica TaxID=2494735 RepID=UPI0010109D69|nr:glycosyl hydrolase [Cellulomonas endophytica]